MRKFKVYVNGQPFEVIVEEAGAQETTPTPGYDTTRGPEAQTPPPTQQTDQAPPRETQQPASPPPSSEPAAPSKPPEEKAPEKAAPKEEVKVEGGVPVTAPMPGSVIEVKVKVGDQVNEGDLLIILEAMKMENEVTAPASGTVKSIHVEKGSGVNTDDVILVIE